MEPKTKKKFVVVIDQRVPSGLAANTAAVLSLSVGRLVDGIVGPDLEDRAGQRHLGITTMPISILTSDQDQIRDIRIKATKIDGLLMVDFCDVAQTSRNYDEYAEKLMSTQVNDLDYMGIALFGNSKKVNRLTGNLALMR